LDIFVDLFIEKFDEVFSNMAKPVIETSEFQNARELIPLAFPYIPINENESTIGEKN
jgi:hypothetical protein